MCFYEIIESARAHIYIYMNKLTDMYSGNNSHFMKCFWIDRHCCFSCRISGYIAWNSNYLLVSGIRSPYSEIWSFIFEVFSLTVQNLLNFGTCIILSDEYILIQDSWVHPFFINTRNWNGYLQADIARAVA